MRGQASRTMMPLQGCRGMAAGGSSWGARVHLLPRTLALSLTVEAVSSPEPRSPWPVDEGYWLGHCQGFQVEGPSGHLGEVDYVVYRSRTDRPDVVVVCSGGWRARTAEVPVGDVIEVLPAQERLVVREGAGPVKQRRARDPMRGFTGSRREARL